MTNEVQIIFKSVRAVAHTVTGSITYSSAAYPVSYKLKYATRYAIT